MKKWTTVPIFADNFNPDNKVGEIKILTSAIPKTPDFIFSIGYRNKAEGFELKCVSIISDKDFLAYLGADL